MSNFTNSGTVTTDVSTAAVACNGWVTCSAHLDSGSGTWTWEFKGVDGVWRTLIGGTDHITLQAYTASNMINAFFGTDVEVRGTASAGSTPVWDWQIMSNPRNRGT
jgi:hypothetical protein